MRFVAPRMHIRWGVDVPEEVLDARPSQWVINLWIVSPSFVASEIGWCLNVLGFHHSAGLVFSASSLSQDCVNLVDEDDTWL